MTKLPLESRSYLLMLGSVIALSLGTVLALNALVDPLWYFGGNRLGSVNFAFNERISKANRIAGHERDYDCIIFGDSRVTLLPERLIEGYRCYNMAFSSGTVSEFVDYANWLRGRGFSPRLVIVGLSATDFRVYVSPRNTPDFVREGRSPPPAAVSYLSLDVAGMSLRSLFGRSPVDRVYDREFRCHAAFPALRYDPQVPVRDLLKGRFDERAPVDLYGKLRAVFPEARFVGYAPPISAWAIATYARIGWLQSYTAALHDAAEPFDRFLDYSAPSPMTADASQTYDGTHYSERANEEIAASLLARQGDVIDLKQVTAKEMLAIYRERLAALAPALRLAEEAQP